MFRSRLLLDVIAPALVICWAAISLYSAAAGQSGFGALVDIEKDVEAKSAELDALRAHRIALEKRADRLSSRSLDPDLAEERIRAVLGYARDGDVIISRDALDAALAADQRELAHPPVGP